MKVDVPDKVLRWVLFCSGLVLVYLCYSLGLSGPFLLDDKQNFVDKLRQTPIEDWHGFLNFVITNTSGLIGRPVSMISLALTGSLHEIEPWPFKFHNLIIHMACGVTIYFLVIKTVRQVNHTLETGKVRFVAGLAAFVWMLHPLQVSTVLYAVQRMAQLSGLFTLLALLAYMHGRQLLAVNTIRARLYLLILFPIAGLLSVLSKENGALIPFYVVLIEAFLFRTRLLSDNWKREELFYTVVYGWLPVILGTLLLIVKWDSFVSYSTRHFTLAERLLTEVHVVAMYIKVTLLPQLSEMSLYHDVMIRQHAGVSTLLILAAFILVPAGLWFVRKRAPLLIFGVGWFYVSHLMESTVIPLELVFEHRNYVAILGFILPLAYYLVVKIDTRRLQIAAAALLLVCMSGLTAIRANEWSNLELMMEVAVQEQPGSLRAQTEYANVLMERREYVRALDVLAQAVEVAPYDYGAVAHQILIRCQMDLEFEELMTDLKEKARLYPGTPYSMSSMESLINVVTKELCSTISLEELSEINRQMLANPQNQNNNEYYSYTLRHKGYLDFAQQNYEDGFASMMEAYYLHPSTQALSDLIDLLLGFGFTEDAAVLLEQYREVNRENHGIYSAKLREMETELEDTRARVQELMQNRQEQQQQPSPLQE